MKKDWTKIDKEIEEDMSKHKEEYGEDNPGNGVKIISMERFMETEGKVEIILLDKKKSRSDYYFCEFDLF